MSHLTDKPHLDDVKQKGHAPKPAVVEAGGWAKFE